MTDDEMAKLGLLVSEHDALGSRSPNQTLTRQRRQQHIPRPRASLPCAPLRRQPPSSSTDDLLLAFFRAKTVERTTTSHRARKAWIQFLADRRTDEQAAPRGRKSHRRPRGGGVWSGLGGGCCDGAAFQLGGAVGHLHMEGRLRIHPPRCQAREETQGHGCSTTSRRNPPKTYNFEASDAHNELAVVDYFKDIYRFYNRTEFFSMLAGFNSELIPKGSEKDDQAKNKRYMSDKSQKQTTKCRADGWHPCLARPHEALTRSACAWFSLPVPPTRDSNGTKDEIP
ncbi:uncharacterized protein [Lolium perenne]|uniref:uncharacterized protein n=1 Tax=Lolium perenne TaxID=4522 RepID=UPI003A99910A